MKTGYAFMNALRARGASPPCTVGDVAALANAAAASAQIQQTRRIVVRMTATLIIYAGGRAISGAISSFFHVRLSRRPRNTAVSMSEVAAFDVLGDVLAGLGLRTRLFCRMEVAAPWSMVFARTDLAHFHVVERGGCWLETAQAPPLELAAGDLLVFTRGGPYQLADRPGREGTPLEEVVHGASDGRYAFVRHGGDGPTSVIVCGSFSFDHAGGHPVLPLLPDVLHQKAGEASTWLEPLLRSLAAEARAARPGSLTILSRLTDVLFVQVLRAWLAEQPDQPSWLHALNEPRLARVLAAVHEDPSQDWSVEKLAQVAGMSRSPFSERFTDVVGESPHAYVARVRMHRAARLLRESDRTVSDIAAAAGYGSVSSFSRVFRKRLGAAPASFRRAARSSPRV
jgi:AraC-like DNA-binding protein